MVLGLGAGQRARAARVGPPPAGARGHDEGALLVQPGHVDALDGRGAVLPGMRASSPASTSTTSSGPRSTTGGRSVVVLGSSGCMSRTVGDRRPTPPVDERPLLLTSPTRSPARAPAQSGPAWAGWKECSPSRSSALIRWTTALICARCVNACGKLPR